MKYGSLLAFLVFSLGVTAQNSRLWATYLGGANEEQGWSVVTDNFGNVFIAGHTESSSEIAYGGYDTTYNLGIDAFLAKIDASGNLVWSTYYGGFYAEYCRSIATDAAGNVYLAGQTYSLGGIAFNGFQNTYGGGADAFLVKFDSSGVRLWATYYGGAGDEYGYSVVTDSLKNVYLAGYTSSASGISSNGFQNSLGGGDDGFLVKFDSSGTRLWATYYGGSGNESSKENH